MLTPWGENLDKKDVLSEYPRPQLRRESYLSLNGEWDYAITDTPEIPRYFDGRMLVPFSPESELSGAERGPRPEEFFWYRLMTTLPEGFRDERILLHFGAVDQIATVWVNGRELITHVGGFTPFTVDISDAVPEDRLIILLRVQDTTDCSWHTRGRQSLKPGGERHTAQSGIWQSVWLESVPENYIRGLRIKPRFDEQRVELWVAGEGECEAVIDEQHFTFQAGKPAVLDLEQLHPWSPEEPYLYSLSLTLGRDKVESYFAMRKFSVDTDERGERRLFLNNRPYFQNGVLDQGRWSDGLMTPPSDQAMVFDIQNAKAMGFNLLRKCGKIEPLRWYYHCDRLGMLVWQDMPAGGEKCAPTVSKQPPQLKRGLRDDNYRAFGRLSEEGRQQFMAELREMINTLYNCPCIALWTIFDEAQGQFDARRVYNRIRTMDSSRLIDHAGGWQDQCIGDVKSCHIGLKKFSYAPDDYNRATVISRFGGLGHRIDGHSFSEKDCSARHIDSANSFRFDMDALYREQIDPAKQSGLSAAVYEQLTDVEEELNGLITYDRRVVKLSPTIIKEIVK